MAVGDGASTSCSTFRTCAFMSVRSVVVHRCGWHLSPAPRSAGVGGRTWTPVTAPPQARAMSTPSSRARCEYDVKSNGAEDSLEHGGSQNRADHFFAPAAAVW